MNKRDGRREWLRATKLARSIHLALCASGEVDRARSLDLATQLVGAVRCRPTDDAIETAQLAQLVQSTLIERGYTLAALRYAEASRMSRADRRRATVVDPVRDLDSLWRDDESFGSYRHN